jgi:predicted Zn-dependent protease
MSAVRPQDLAERALELSRVDGCVVIAQESSTVNLRWAGNTLTTNGDMRGRALTVVATVDGRQGTAAAAVSRSNPSLVDLETLVRAAEEAARAAGPADDAQPLATPEQAASSQGWDDAPDATSSAVLGDFAPALGEAFVRARAEGRELFGFAEHDVTTTYLATSTGVRLRHAQPAGRVEVTGKSHDRTRSTYVGRATRDFTDIDVAGLEAEVVRRLGWMDRRIELAAGRYDTILPPSAVADLVIPMYW